jgi:hypothetical protein
VSFAGGVRVRGADYAAASTRRPRALATGFCDSPRGDECITNSNQLNHACTRFTAYTLAADADYDRLG